MEISKIAIIGNGNVGTHLQRALGAIGKKVTMISGRDATFTSSLMENDLIIISVKDGFIPMIAAKLGLLFSSYHKHPVVVHTSGSVPLTALERLSGPIGVVYPMQTFTKSVEMNYSDIPFMIEASDSATLNDLMRLASEISVNVIEADSEIRANYHIGAVLTCNFTNHLCRLADDFLLGKGLDFKLLLPLLRQTIGKLSTINPADAQTGPAARNDKKVMQYHLDKLKYNPELASIYSMLSDSIIKHNANNN